MNTQLKITKVGNSAAVILTKEVLVLLRSKIGDSLHLSEGPDGIRISPYDPEFAEQMERAETIMREDRDILRVLAK